jgi:hypothetical protein
MLPHTDVSARLALFLTVQSRRGGFASGRVRTKIAVLKSRNGLRTCYIEGQHPRP